MLKWKYPQSDMESKKRKKWRRQKPLLRSGCSEQVVGRTKAESQEHGGVFFHCAILSCCSFLSIQTGTERQPHKEELRHASVLRDNCSHVCNKLLCYVAKHIFRYNERIQNFYRFVWLFFVHLGLLGCYYSWYTIWKVCLLKFNSSWGKHSMKITWLCSWIYLAQVFLSLESQLEVLVWKSN